jgi:hypothetical protein
MIGNYELGITNYEYNIKRSFGLWQKQKVDMFVITVGKIFHRCMGNVLLALVGEPCRRN